MLFTAFTVMALLGLGHSQLASQGRHRPSGLSSPRAFHLPKVDSSLLMAKEDSSHGGYQFAEPLDVYLPQGDSGFWELREDGSKLWTLTIVSEGALNLGVTFDGFHLPEGGELFLVGQKEVRGAFTSQNNPKDGHFTSFPVQGDSLTLEYFHPAGAKEMPVLDIIKVSHGYRPLLNYGDSGRCNINVACDKGEWTKEIRSVGMLLSGFGSRFCTGALVNNARNDGTQYFLTAAHCSVGTTDLIMFDYQSPSCETPRDGPTDHVIGQLTRLANNANSDFTLLRIEEPIPASWNVYLSGVSGVNVAPKEMVGIHHPRGDIKKISFAYKQGTPDRWSAAEPGLWHWRVPFWDQGTTEPGSSGSPLFDQEHRVVGQLHGGAASCSNTAYDSYGACWASWSLGLGEYLDPRGGNPLINGTDLNALRA